MDRELSEMDPKLARALLETDTGWSVRRLAKYVGMEESDCMDALNRHEVLLEYQVKISRDVVALRGDSYRVFYESGWGCLCNKREQFYSPITDI